MSIIGDQADGLFIQPDDPAVLDSSVIVREVDAIAFGKLSQLNGTFSLSKQIQSLDHHAVHPSGSFPKTPRKCCWEYQNMGDIIPEQSLLIQ